MYISDEAPEQRQVSRCARIVLRRTVEDIDGRLRRPLAVSVEFRHQGQNYQERLANVPCWTDLRR